ncbi:MAG: hypothetical protein LBI60_02080 [Bacteroidales bacterium]|jgi:hypothetical protein|nr:hypothetical protein [Bacteroidales bacterium]
MNTTIKKIMVILAGVFLLCSCVKEEVRFQYIIRVYVTDDEHNNIEDADITLKYLKNGKTAYQQKYNKAEGYYEFTDLIDTGEYQIWVHKRGNIYRDNHDDAILNEQRVVAVDIKLEKF